VLSRCQRFDLKRVDMEELVGHFTMIAASEGVKIDDDALALIAQAAQGSVRDGLSILDQAIAHAKDQVHGDDVRVLLGLADRMRIFDLLESVLKGEAAQALKQCEALFRDGADPSHILIDLAETVHILTRKKILDDRGSRALSEAERARAAQLVDKLSMPVLSRCWQMLIKGLEECTKAPNQMAAVEMILIRIAYAADLPSPEELARVIGGLAGGDGFAPATSRAATQQHHSAPRLQNQGTAPQVMPDRGAREDHSGPAHTNAVKKQPGPFYEGNGNTICSFEDIAELVGREGGLVLKIAFEENVRPISFERGAIEIALKPDAPRGLANDIKRVLNNSTGENWVVAVSDQQGDETLFEKKQREHLIELEAVKQHPLVRAALKQFPDARITDIRAIKESNSGLSDDKQENE
jgi:DNA polymerase-3 subunit gamma/tau